MRPPAGPVLLLLLLVLVAMNLGSAAAHAQTETRVPIWTRFEAGLKAASEYPNPLQDPQVTIELTSPTGKKQVVAAFWDGFQDWKFRFAPDETGRWTWRSRSSKTDDQGLHEQSGAFTAVTYTGRNALYKHGVLRVSQDRRTLVHADGTPFFWLGDTAWNGPLKADAKSWQVYLKDRTAKGFNVVQFVSTQWRTATGNADARPAFYLHGDKVTIDPVFFRWMDERVDATNDAGLVAAPVLIWAISDGSAKLNPGNMMPDDQITALARHIVARWGAHHVVWFLAGDADYRGEKAERWKKIGRAVFGEKPARLATMHPGGGHWVADEFRHEPWFAFNGYQSGHGNSDKSLRWLTEGPPATEWQKEPALAHINLEPNYEAHIARSTQRTVDAHDVRRASYWSLLVTPPAGVTYGGHGIWSWELAPNPPMTHPYTGTAPAWHKALGLPGATSMKHLKNFFASLKWWTLRPAQELLAAQPGTGAPAKFVAAARSEDERLAVIYVPTDGEVSVRFDRLPTPARAEWFDPVTGTRKAASRVKNEGTQTLKAPKATQDWILLLRADGKRQTQAASR